MAIQMTILGGLGNLMFQSATLEYLGKKFGLETDYPNRDKHFSMLTSGVKYNNNLYAADYPLLFNNFDWHVTDKKEHPLGYKVQLPYTWKPITDVRDGMSFHGYCQSEKFWDCDKEFVQNLFDPSDFVLDQIKEYEYLFDGETCAVHIRRGDMINHPDVYKMIDEEYIISAKEKLGDGNIKYIVFSDDIPWCKENLKDGEYVFLEGDIDYLYLFLISQCNHKILASSSFGWWGSMISKKDGITVTPKKWIVKPSIDDVHVVPDNWIKI